MSETVGSSILNRLFLYWTVDARAGVCRKKVSESRFCAYYNKAELLHKGYKNYENKFTL